MPKIFEKNVENSHFWLKFVILDTRPNYPVLKKLINYPGTRVLDTRHWKH
jgi:hypothetical protein